MNILSRLTNQTKLSPSELLAIRDRLPENDPAIQEIDAFIQKVQELTGNLYYPEFEIPREDQFDKFAAATFSAWILEEAEFTPGKEMMDAESDYIAWLRPLCATLRINDVEYLIDHKIMTPEDWFYRRSTWT